MKTKKMSSKPHTSLLAIYLTESVILTLVNLIALYAILNKRILKESFNNILLFILFTLHVLSGISNLANIAMILNGLDGSLGRQLVITARNSIGSAELLFTLLPSMERFVAIRKPFFYAQLGKKHALLFLGTSFLVLLSFWVALYYSSKAFLVGTTITIFGGIFIVVSNTLLYRSVKKQCRKISRTIVDNSLQRQKAKREDMKQRKLKTLKICIYITLSYLFTWVPLSVCIVVDLYVKFEVTVIYIFQMFGFSNGIWDVIIYFFLHTKARRKVIRALSSHVKTDESAL